MDGLLIQNTLAKLCIAYVMNLHIALLLTNLQLPKNSATRDTEAIKRICTGYLKLLFPNATDVSKVDVSLFETYCFAPAMEMRRVIKTQLGIIDEGEFGGMTIPEITIKEQYREKREV
mgnify:CR=1 FL=1